MSMIKHDIAPAAAMAAWLASQMSKLAAGSPELTWADSGASGTSALSPGASEVAFKANEVKLVAWTPEWTRNWRGVGR
jgi:hypothetical protein